MKVSFIIVLYKTPKKEIDRLKKEIRDLGFMNYEVYFVDNTKDNKGYAAGVNKTLKVARKQSNKKSIDLFIIINPDISLKNLKAKDFFNVSRKFDIAGFAFKQRSKIYYGGEIDKWKLSGGLNPTSPRLRGVNQFIKVDFVSGSLMIVKRQVVEKIGLFDESYFMYYEDVDYCVRAKKAGFKIGIDTNKIYEHFELSTKNPKKEEWLAKSHQLFFSKYANILQKIFKSNFVFNFASLNFSSFLNKFLNFSLFIFLVGYLTPADYGIYILVWAFIEFFSPFLDFGTTQYGLTYLAQEKKQDLNRLISLRFFLSIIIFVVITPLSLLFFYSQLNVSFYVFLASMVVLSNMWSGSYLVVTSLKGKVYKASIISVIFNILLIALLILSLLLYHRLDLVFFILAMVYFIYSLVNWHLVKKESLNLKIKFSLKEWLPILKKSFFFVLIGFFSGLYFKQDVFLLKYLQSDKVVGVYSAGYKFLEALTMMAGSYSMAVLPILSKMAGNIKKLKQRIRRDLIIFSLFGFLISLIFYIVSPYFLTIFLKAKYQNSLDVAQIVIFALPFILGTTVFFNTLYILKKVNIVIFIYLFQIFINLLLNLFLIPKYSLFASAYITVFCEILNLFLGYYFVRKYLKYENRS